MVCICHLQGFLDLDKLTLTQKMLIGIYLIVFEYWSGLSMLYKGWDKPELKIEADEKFNEMDITVRLGYPFKQNAHYTVGESGRIKKAQKINHDLYIGQRDFKIEVKYLKNWVSSANTRAASKSWSVFQQDFDWLMDEIDNGKNGKVAFVIGWFNCVDSFSQLSQLGTGNGAYPLADERKLAYFPFLIKKDENAPKQTKNLAYDYENAYIESPVRISSKRKGKYRCMFIGEKDDKPSGRKEEKRHPAVVRHDGAHASLHLPT